MFEHHKQPLASRRTFVRRLAFNGLVALGILLVSLGIGVLGYHYFEDLAWIDALLNASMILGGMGPVTMLQTSAGKIFATLYALYSGLISLASITLLAAPIFHRFMHHFHLQEDK